MNTIIYIYTENKLIYMTYIDIKWGNSSVYIQIIVTGECSVCDISYNACKQIIQAWGPHTQEI